MTIVAVAVVLLACGSKTPNAGNNTDGSGADQTNVAQQVADVPPVLAVYVKGLPLFAPFNEGDLMAEGKALRESPEKYTKFIINGTCLDISYQEEKNKGLEHDDSYLNQYLYQSKDKMKGQLFRFADAKAMDQYLQSHGDMTAEGELLTMDYIDGVIVSADYMKNRSVLEGSPTTTEDPDGPQFDAATVAAVEKVVGAKVLKNRISYVAGDEYHFGVMTTQPNDQYGVAAWVLEKAGEVAVFTDTCEVVDGEVYWSNYDPEEYNEPAILAMVKGKDGIDIFCSHMETDEQVNYILMRQRGKKMQKNSMGGFYQLYE